MPDRSPRNRVRNVAAAGITVFVLIFALLAVRMASGKDPALGTRTTAKPSKHVAAAPQPVQPAQPSYSDPGYDGGYVVPQQQQDVQPQQQSQAPLQSGTS